MTDLKKFPITERPPDKIHWPVKFDGTLVIVDYYKY